MTFLEDLAEFLSPAIPGGRTGDPSELGPDPAESLEELEQFLEGLRVGAEQLERDLIDVGALDAPLSEKTPSEARQALENIPREALKEAVDRQAMTDFNTFMSIGLSRCGSDRETFGALVEVWNREKDDIKEMTPAEVRQNLSCP